MRKSWSSRQVIEKLKNDGWYLKSIRGDHHQFIHPYKAGKTTVPHPKKDLREDELKSIEKQSGIML